MPAPDYNSIQLELKRMDEWVTRSAEILDSASAPATRRLAVAAAMFHLGVHYQDSIRTLARAGLYAGMFALLRPLVEAYFRGAWLWYAATEKEIDQFAEKGKVVDSARLDRDLAKVNDRFGLVRQGIYSVFGRALHDFSHGGREQMWSRIDGRTITENHTAANVLIGLEASRHIGYLCSVELCHLADSPALAHQLHDKFHSIFKGATPPNRDSSRA